MGNPALRLLEVLKNNNDPHAFILSGKRVCPNIYVLMV